MSDLNPPVQAVDRHAERQVRVALDDTRIVALVGPRQSGKTTLSRKIARDRGMGFVTLDDDQFRRFAVGDPDGFVRGLGSAVIDEVQRAPGLVLALKRAVDEDPRAGRFLITGSVDLFDATISPDSLAGRVETVELLPFSQAEIERRGPSTFLEQAFSGDFPSMTQTGFTQDLVGRVLGGGYPEALSRVNLVRRQAWFSAYARALATHDANEIAEVHKTHALTRLMNLAAATSGQTVNLAALAASLGVDAKTVDRWLTLLERMFLLRRVAAWHCNELKRLTKAPKLHFLDSGLLAALRRVSADDIAADRTLLGSLLEGFVFSELSKLVAGSEIETVISHVRDREQVEVDFVLERGAQLVAIEVKASVSLRPADFQPMKKLRDTIGSDFSCGIILHDGERVQRVGDRLFAMPVSQLWS
ncbi:MAG: ATP-binding protein [Steroidobacteraceae bacterium]